jgi:hypothetical protein
MESQGRGLRGRRAADSSQIHEEGKYHATKLLQASSGLESLRQGTQLFQRPTQRSSVVMIKEALAWVHSSVFNCSSALGRCDVVMRVA